MMGNIFLDLIIALGCAILFGLICIALAITWWAVKIIAQAAKATQNKTTSDDAKNT